MSNEHGILKTKNFRRRCTKIYELKMFYDVRLKIELHLIRTKKKTFHTPMTQQKIRLKLNEC